MLEPGATLLKEVTDRSDKIREQGDAITYNIGSFAQVQDRSIGDILKRMPAYPSLTRLPNEKNQYVLLANILEAYADNGKISFLLPQAWNRLPSPCVIFYL